MDCFKILNEGLTFGMYCNHAYQSIVLKYSCFNSCNFPFNVYMERGVKFMYGTNT